MNKESSEKTGPAVQTFGKGRLSDMSRREAIDYWQALPPEERMQAILDVRDFYYEVMKPGTGPKD